MSTDRHPYAGLVELAGLTLPLMASAAPRPLGEGEVLIPTGNITVLHPFGDVEFFRHGWNSWSPSGWRRLSDAPLRVYDSPGRLLTADDAVNDTPLAHSGSAVGALRSPDGNVLLLGALGLGAPRVGATESTLWGSVETEAGEWYLGFGDELTVFGRYAGLLADRLGRRTTKAGRVWSSWYSCYEDISEDLLRDLVGQLHGFPFDVVQIDDGWEKSVGDWEPNDKFGSGMGEVAHMITDAGMRPGLWLAPFIALPHSTFACERSDLLIKGKDGLPLIAGYNWGGPYYCLDTTNAEVEDYLRTLFTHVKGWGFSYLKLDFLYAAALDGVRTMDVHREQAYRDAVAMIREVVGDDMYLLGCGVPILPSIGVFDGVRVGPDVAAFWDNAERSGDPTGVGAKNALLASIHRQWLASVIETDPDAVYFRRRRSLLDEGQRQTLQDLATVLGFKSTSDPMSWLCEREREQLRTWLETDETIDQVGPYTFHIDGRTVDFSEWISGYTPPTSTNAC